MISLIDLPLRRVGDDHLAPGAAGLDVANCIRDLVGAECALDYRRQRPLCHAPGKLTQVFRLELREERQRPPTTSDERELRPEEMCERAE